MAVALVRSVHALYVAFVLVAPLLLLLGAWVPALRSRALRVAHLAALVYLTAQLAFDWACPLSELENGLAGRPPGATFLPANPADAVPGGTVLVGVVVAIYLGLSAAGHLIGGCLPRGVTASEDVR